MRRGRFRRLGMWDALPPFNGGKRRLAGLIFGAIDKVVPRSRWPSLTFVDGFMGGGSIALFAKAQGFGRVIGIDIARRSIVVGEALITNSRSRLARDDVIRVLAPRSDGLGPVEQELVPEVFTRDQARVIDTALSLATGAKDTAKGALYTLLALRVALLAHPFSYVRRGTIRKVSSGEFETITPSALPQYVRGLRLASFPVLWDLAERINRGVFEGSGKVQQGDALDLLPGTEADILYADPPYAATRSYEAAYKVIDRILGVETRPTSPFTAHGGARMIDVLLERAKHIPVVALSFGNETVSIQELEQKMVQHGRVTRAVAIAYSRLAALSKAEKSTRDREFLVVGWDPETPLLRKNLVDGFRDNLHQSHFSDLVASAQAHADLRGSQAAATCALAHDRLDKREPPLAQKSAVVLRRSAVAELQTGVDEPDSVLSEGSFHRDREGIVLSPERHDSTLPCGGPEVKNEQVNRQ